MYCTVQCCVVSKLYNAMHFTVSEVVCPRCLYSAVQCLVWAAKWSTVPKLYIYTVQCSVRSEVYNCTLHCTVFIVILNKSLPQQRADAIRNLVQPRRKLLKWIKYAGMWVPAAQSFLGAGYLAFTLELMLMCWWLDPHTWHSTVWTL